MSQGLYLLSPSTEMPTDILLEKIIRIHKETTVDAFLYDVAVKADTAKLAKAVQGMNIAFILKDDIELALKINTDGIHLSEYTPEISKIRKKIGDMALGVMCATKDEAMRAGESGADYIGFNGENASELAEWWVELFNIPCVVFNSQAPIPAADFAVCTLAD